MNKRLQQVITFILTAAMGVSLLFTYALAEEEPFTLTPDEDGIYHIGGPSNYHGDMDFAEMVRMINELKSGETLHFKLSAKPASGGGYNYLYQTSEAITIPAGAEVLIDLTLCSIEYAGEDFAITNHGTFSLTGQISSDYYSCMTAENAILNDSSLNLKTVNVKGAIDNSGKLTTEAVLNDYMTPERCKIQTLVNSGEVMANHCEFTGITCSGDGKVDVAGGTIRNNPGIPDSGKIVLNGSSKLNFMGNIGLFTASAITLNDTSIMTIDGDMTTGGSVPVITCQNPEQLQLLAGEYYFNPTCYVPDGYTVTRSSASFYYPMNMYTISKITEDESPDITISTGSYIFDGKVDVTISTSTSDAQVFYSSDADTPPIECQLDCKETRYTSLPVGSTIWATAVKAGCPANSVSQTIEASPITGIPAPDIYPAGGDYPNSVTVTIAAPKGYTNADIYYTTDGRTPGLAGGSTGGNTSTVPGTGNNTANEGAGTAQITGIKYTGPFTLTSSATVQAVAILEGRQSEIAAQCYTITSGGGSGGDSGSSGGGSGGSSGGGGGSSSSGSGSNQSNTSTTKNPDGSTTTTTTDKATGTVTEVTKGKDGTVTTVETKKDGTVTETVKSGGMTSTVVTDKDGTITKAEVNVGNVTTNRTVVLPVGVPIVSNIAFAPKLKIYLADASRNVKVAIPVENATTSTVAVLVAADGSEKIVPTSVVTAEGVVLPLDGSATVKVVDNSKDFTDVSASFWASDPVAFVTSRELFNGTSAETFTPNAPMTREMLMTVLARLDGADTTVSPLAQGMAWATEKGISDGSNPGGSISREQLATMLYRYAGSPAASGSLADFNDADSVGGYAQEAMQWAVGNGIISGTGSRTLNPQGEATRAQVAAMLQRYIVSLNG